MAERSHLTNAPIQEAVIDIRFSPLVGDAIIDRLAAEFAGEGGVVQDLWETAFELQLEAGKTSSTNRAVRLGKRIDRPDRRSICQLRGNGLTFSRLPPYDDWISMSSEAAVLWKRYLSEGAAGSINRVAVRYVNALELDLPIPDFGALLTCPPEVPEGLPQSVVSAINRTQVINPDTRDVMMITQVIEGPTADGGAVRLVFDIDVTHDCAVHAQDFADIEAILQRLHDVKNDVFFSYLTDKALEKYR